MNFCSASELLVSATKLPPPASEGASTGSDSARNSTKVPAGLDVFSKERLGRVVFSEFSSPATDHRRALDHVRTRLLAAQYNEASICELLGAPSLQAITPHHIPYFCNHLLDDSYLSILIKALLLTQPVSTNALKIIFERRNFEFLIDLGIFVDVGDACISQISLYPVGDMYFATDHRYPCMFWPDEVSQHDAVMHVGGDSISLLNATPQLRDAEVLDLCSGSGVQGISASKWARSITSVEISKRAIRFSRLNAQLNGCDRFEVIEGSLYEPIGNKRFDLIVANPPFVPRPAGVSHLLYRDGGVAGEEILAAIFRDAAEHLTDDGTLVMVSDFIGFDAYREKLLAWWSGERPAAILVLAEPELNPIQYALDHVPYFLPAEQHLSELGKWIDVLRDKDDFSCLSRGLIVARLVDHRCGASFCLFRIRNALKPIREHITNYFDHRLLHNQLDAVKDRMLEVAPDVAIRLELSGDGDGKLSVGSATDPFFGEEDFPLQLLPVLEKLRRERHTWSSLSCDRELDSLIANAVLRGYFRFSEIEARP